MTEFDGLCRQGDKNLAVAVQSFTVAPTHTHTEVECTLSHTLKTILLYDLILYISWYVWYCGVNVVSCYDALGRGLSGYFWTFEWDRGGSVSVWLSPPLSLLPPPVFEESRSLCYPSLVRLVTENSKRRFVGTDHKHIPDSSLSVLSFFFSFFFQSFLLQQYNMCLVLADSHVYKVHICVHMCNTRYSSNLLLWLLLIMMMILVSAPFFFLSWFLVDELCWFGCSQELKKGRWLFMILHTLFYFRGLWTF